MIWHNVCIDITGSQRYKLQPGTSTCTSDACNTNTTHSQKQIHPYAEIPGTRKITMQACRACSYLLRTHTHMGGGGTHSRAHPSPTHARTLNENSSEPQGSPQPFFLFQCKRFCVAEAQRGGAQPLRERRSWCNLLDPRTVLTISSSTLKAFSTSARKYTSTLNKR